MIAHSGLLTRLLRAPHQQAFTQSLWKHAWAIAANDPAMQATEHDAVEILEELLQGRTRANAAERRALNRATQRAGLTVVPRTAAQPATASPDDLDGDDPIDDSAFADLFDPHKETEFT